MSSHQEIRNITRATNKQEISAGNLITAKKHIKSHYQTIIQQNEKQTNKITTQKHEAS